MKKKCLELLQIFVLLRTYYHVAILEISRPNPNAQIMYYTEIRAQEPKPHHYFHRNDIMIFNLHINIFFFFFENDVTVFLIESNECEIQNTTRQVPYSF